MSGTKPRTMAVWPALRERLWAWTRPRIDRLVYANGGLGDELMLTAIARAAVQQGRPLHILSSLPVLWRGNPDPLSVQTGVARWHYATVTRRWLPTSVVHLSYENTRPEHIAAQMASKAGIRLPEGWKPRIVLPRTPAREPRLLVLQNSCRGARYAASTKEWPAERWQALVDRLAPDYTVLQLGTAQDAPLRGVQDLRGRTTLHEAAEHLARAHLFIGLESGLMHLAAAVDTPAVILQGGRTPPSSSGYAGNLHLTRQPPCAGCGLNEGCPHQVLCMDIPTEEVLAAVHSALSRPTG